MKQATHVNQKTLGITNIDESAEENGHWWEYSQSIKYEPAKEKVLTLNFNGFWIMFKIKNVRCSKIKKEKDENTRRDEVEEKLDIQKMVDDIWLVILPKKTDCQNQIKNSWEQAEDFG